MEGLKRNVFNLKYLTDQTNADLVFLSEPNIFSHDVDTLLNCFNKYKFYTNTEDKYDLEAAFTKTKTYGGTMVLWKNEIDPYVSIYPVSSPSFTPLIYSPTGSPTTVHIALYLPTSGQEIQFLEQLAELKMTIDEITLNHPGSILYLRGDSNVNPNNKKRAKIFASFCEELSLSNIQINHKTYHHFLGGDLFNSNIDVILQSSSAPFPEKLLKIFCQDDFPQIDSHHDAILTTFSIPSSTVLPPASDLLKPAPRVENQRHKIFWNNDNIPEYEALAGTQLSRIRESWSKPDSSLSLSILLNLTNKILSETAIATNRSVSTTSPPKLKNQKISENMYKARKVMNTAHKTLKMALNAKSGNLHALRISYKTARRHYRFTCRRELHKNDITRDTELFSVFSSSSPAIFRTIRLSKSASGTSVPFMTVGSKKYPENMVGDGLFDSISTLKTQDQSSLHSSPCYASWSNDYKYILTLSENKRDIPAISLQQSSSILISMKSTVSDFESITPLHFQNAGKEGHLHFNHLMNRIITDVNSSSAKELNTVLALLLHKGHGKLKTSDRSYRTISTCPVLAKALDMYIHDLYIDLWNNDQAETQYQGQGTSHELASLMVTEATQISLFCLRKPLYSLYLDARSAFDTVVVEFLIRNLYLSGMTGNSLHYVKNRLLNRVTYCDWQNNLMGPIYDEHGLEQGGCNSSDLYKMYNNNLLKTVQMSNQGVKFGEGVTISCIGQADDIALISSDVFCLLNILNLTLSYCRKFHIELCADKTKLLVTARNEAQKHLLYNPLVINGKAITISNEAEHVGVIRSPDGNLPHLLGRLVAHKKAKGALLSSGIAHNHRGNPAASVKLEQIYGVPVLLSGVASLVLTPWETNIIDQHYKSTLSNLLKLYPNTPSSFIYFMAGSLPGEALLHKRQLGLFNMICHLPDNPLHKRAVYALTCSKSSMKSWFTQIRDLCLLYNLPHPLLLLQNPLSKEAFKKLSRSMIIDHWEVKLRQEASPLISMTAFKPQYHYLAKPHPILWTAGPNPYEVSKAIIQCRMLSGRYRTELLSSHWSSNRLGYCLNSECSEVPETLEHILLWCPSYHEKRVKLRALSLANTDSTVDQFVSKVLDGTPSLFLQFLLDASVFPEVICLVQMYGDQPLKTLFHITRTWCFTIHKERASILQRWPHL